MEDRHDRALRLHDCLIASKAGEQIGDLHAVTEVQVRGWFVEGEDRCLLRKAKRDCRKLSLTGAQGAHVTVLQVCCANAFDCRSGALAIMCTWTSRAATVWDSP